MNKMHIISFMLSIFSFPVIAMDITMTATEERKRQPITAHIDEKNYTVKDVRKVDTSDTKLRGTYSLYKYPTILTAHRCMDVIRMKFTSKNGIESISLIGKEIGKEVTIKIEREYPVDFEGSSYNDLRKKLQTYNERSKLSTDRRTFIISLIDETETEGITLELTEDEVQTILNRTPYISNYLSKIVIIFGIAGMAALTYYFDLHSKIAALVGRS